jgi:hypothetical protein
LAGAEMQFRVNETYPKEVELQEPTLMKCIFPTVTCNIRELADPLQSSFEAIG